MVDGVNCSKVTCTANKTLTILPGQINQSQYNATNTISPHLLANSYFLCHVQGNVFLENNFPGKWLCGKCLTKKRPFRESDFSRKRLSGKSLRGKVTYWLSRKWLSKSNKFPTIIPTRKLYCVEYTQYSIRPKWSAICNRALGPPESLTQMASRSLQPFLQGSLGGRPNWQTDRPRYSVDNNRRSAQWRSQILLFSMATTSNYWSSWLKYTMPAFPP